MTPQPFTIHVPDADIADLRMRLSAVRWPGDFGNEEGRYGVQEDWLKGAIAYWRDGYDWRAVEAEMNAFPHYKVDVDGVPVHFIHLKSSRADAIPLILSHGWPWSFWDWRHVIRPLAEPGDDALPAFHVVVPSVPGFAFSSPMRTTGLDAGAVGRLWHKLMRDVLGYDRFAAAGGDWGSLITAQLGHEFPEDMIGVGLTLPFVPGENLEALLNSPFPAEEQWMADRMAETRPTIASHIAVQMADPQTLAYALNDSPAGLAAWLWERRRNWSDARQDSAARDLDSLCTLASLYWFTGTIGSSFRIYAEHFSKPWKKVRRGEKVIPVPTAFAIAPKELVFAPREVMAQRTDLQRWTLLDRGGHFVPAEAPEELVDLYRDFFGAL